MANNINKVILGSEVLLDLTADTVTAAKMLKNTTAHDKSGSSITGTIPTKTSSDMTVSGAVVTAPAGYYASGQSKRVASGTQGTPSAVKEISDGVATVTPSCTDITGYVVGQTKTGTPVTVDVSELVSGTVDITENNTTVDVSRYQYANISIFIPPTPPSQIEELTVTANGYYHKTMGGYNPVTVNVGSDQAPLTITRNNRKYERIGGGGYNPVTVEIPEVAAVSVSFVPGEECVCSDGTSTFRTSDESGLALFILPNTGTWTVSCGSHTEEVAVESNHVYNVNLKKLILFSNSIGGDNTEVTGGWDRVSAGNIETTDTYIRYLSSSGGTVRSATTLNMIDLTNYSKIVINGHLNTTSSVTMSNYGFWVNKTKVNTITSVTRKVQIPKGSSPTEFEMDISDLTGEYYIGLSNSHSSAYTFIYECYLI